MIPTTLVDYAIHLVGDYAKRMHNRKVRYFGTGLIEKLSYDNWNYEDVKKWGKDSFLFADDVVLYPAYWRNGEHFGIVVVLPQERLVLYLDSLIRL